MENAEHKKWAIAIDLGTANLSAAVYREATRQIEPIPFDDGYFLPSYIGFSDSEHLIGSEALRRVSAHPESTICSIKPFLASRYGQYTLDSLYLDTLPFRLQQNDRAQDAIAKVKHKGEMVDLKSVSLFAMLLSRLKKKAESHLGGTVCSALIGIPASFNTEQRNEVADAAEIAGMSVLDLLSDPHGLLITASMDIQAETSIDTDYPLLALDIGAGFCSAAYAWVLKNTIDVQRVACDLIGGNDMTARLYKSLLSMAKKKGMEARDARAVQRLWKECEKAKVALSFSQTYSFELEAFDHGRVFAASITREKFESLCPDLFRSCLAVVDKVLGYGKDPKGELSQVVVSGGSSLVPMLQKLLADYFPNTRIRYHHYDNAGVRGLAVQAAILAGVRDGHGTLDDHLLLTVSPFSIGIETLGGIMSFLVPKNTTVPTMKREKFIWNGEHNQPQQLVGPGPSHSSDSSRQGVIHVYEGERQRVKHNRLLGTIDISTLLPANINPDFALEVTVDIDARRKLEVVVQAKDTGKVVRQSLQDAGRLSQKEKRELLLKQFEFDKFEAAASLLVELRCIFDEMIAGVRGHLKRLPLKTMHLNEQLARIEDWLGDNQHASMQEYEEKKLELDRMFTEALQISLQYVRTENGKLVDEVEPKDPLKEHREHTDMLFGIADAAYTNGEVDNLLVQHLSGLAATDENGQKVSSKQPSKASDRTMKALKPLGRKIGLMSANTDSEAAVKPVTRPDTKGVKIQVKDVSEYNKPMQQDAVPDIAAIVPGEEQNIPGAQASRTGNSEPVSETTKQADERIASTLNIGAIETSKRGLSTSSSMSDLRSMDTLFDTSPKADKKFTDSEFERIATYLRNTGKQDWSHAPRLYTVLRLIDQVDCMDIFQRQDMNDMCFPFTSSTLPAALQPSVQSRFIALQSVAFMHSKSFQVESGQQTHVYFSEHDPSPFQVVARLGRGAHASVDKVMSSRSQKEFARKLFRRSRGLQAENVKSFKTEMGILCRLHHRHCVKLISTYSDPKYFALIMKPVGDCNLSEYYAKCHNATDKLSLLRGFFGCLASAVQYLHNSQVRHRDIKPQNIIVKNDQVYLADFGIAHCWENLTRATTTADSAKTMIYAAPEVVRVESRNTAADIWSLGCVFLEMATVLGGKTVEDMRGYFREQSDSSSFYENAESIRVWADDLRATHSPSDNIALAWALSMLQQDQRSRPTAATLYQDIFKESREHGIPFCGPCCDGIESTEEEDDDGGLWED